MEGSTSTEGVSVSRELIKSICSEAGADDAGVVEIGRPALKVERGDILRVYPKTRSVISIVKAGNRDNMRSSAVNIADDEFKRNYEDVTRVSREVVKRLNAHGVRGVYNTYGFPSDMNRWPNKPWDIAHKTVAVAAGNGAMGISRLVLHPKHGSFIALNTVLIDAKADSYDTPLTEEENPCIKCMLCVTVCPTGSVLKEGFDFMGCFTHSYRNMLSGFLDWIETIAGARSAKHYRAQVRDSETLGYWQSLTYGHNYKCSYCLAVCPAGTEAGELYAKGKKLHVQEHYRPLKDKPEPVYVQRGTRGDVAVGKNDAKEARYVKTPIRPQSIDGFVLGLRVAFNPVAAGDLKMRAHFTFTGREERKLTAIIAGGGLKVQTGLVGEADLRVRADSDTWLGMLNEEISLPRALLSGKLKVSNPLLMSKFKGSLAI